VVNRQQRYTAAGREMEAIPKKLVKKANRLAGVLVMPG
jgi:hypothetical protein